MIRIACPSCCRGFTLIEMVIVIVVLGILSASTAVFLRGPITSFFDVERRTGLVDAGELAMAKLTQDISRASTGNPANVTITPLGAGFSLVIDMRPAAPASSPTQTITYTCLPNAANPALGELRRNPGNNLLATNLAFCQSSRSPAPGTPAQWVTLALRFDNAGDRLALYHAVRVDQP